MTAQSNFTEEDAEESVLGSLLHHDDAERERTLAEIMPLCDEAMFTGGRKAIFDAIRDLRKHGAPVSVLVVTQALRDSGELATVGGPAYVSGLGLNVVPAAAARHQIERLHSLAARRESLRVFEAACASIKSGTDPDMVLNRVSQEACALQTGLAIARGSRKPPLIEVLSPAQLRDYVPPEGARLVGDYHVTRGSVFVIGGAPCVGKSRAAVALAVSGATRTPWLGLTVHRRFKTLILQTENGPIRLKDEFGAMCDKEIDDAVRVSRPPPFGFCFDRSEFCGEVRAIIKEFQPDVVIIDPWNAATPDDKSRDYLETFKLIRSVLPSGDEGPALGIVAHTRKPRADGRASGRALLHEIAGSHVLGSVPRSVFVIQPASDDPKDNRVVWTCCKNNDGEMGSPSAWERGNGAFTAVEDFDWEAFYGKGKNDGLSKSDVPAVLHEMGKATKQQLVTHLKSMGASKTSAYRWVNECDEEGLISCDLETGICIPAS